MKRLLAAATTMALVAIGAVASAAQAEPADQPRDDKAIQWGACDDPALLNRQAECGFVTVPMDYSKPDGDKIKLAVSRIAHTVPAAKYQGVMLVNPGGPGGKGRGLAVLGSLVPHGAGAAYDWIGFDPRGVGASKPALSCDTGYTGYDRPEYVPSRPGIAKTWLARAQGYADDCAKAGGALLDHLKSLDTVRDMESIRLALGAIQINFYGFSYGTYLGQVYATMHPDRVRRMVLDGNVDPRRVWYGANLDQDIAFDRNIRIYFGWIAKHDNVYHLGRTGRAVQRRYYAEQARLTAKPAGGKIGPAEFTDIFLQPGYYVFGWDKVAQAFSDWVHKRDATGLKDLYDANNPQEKDADNGYAIYLGVQCTDVQWPLDWAKWEQDNWRVHRRAPFETWGNAWYNAPCRNWAGQAGIPVTVSGEMAPPILLLSESLDAATPYAGSLEVRKRFPRSALVEGVGGTTHAGSLFGDKCVDNTVAAYLATGALPHRVKANRSDKRCAPIPPPEATRGGAPAPAERTAATVSRLALQRLIAGR
jgi:pimeloyl-ACP methyl ester carboxylesterase